MYYDNLIISITDKLQSTGLNMPTVVLKHDTAICSTPLYSDKNEEHMKTASAIAIQSLQKLQPNAPPRINHWIVSGHSTSV